jgi:hypothetical protein
MVLTLKSLLEDGHHVLLELLSRETLEICTMLNTLADELVVVLSLVLLAVGGGSILLQGFAAGLDGHFLVHLPIVGLAVDGLRRVGEGDEDLIAAWGREYSLWTMGRQASPDSMVLVR